MTIKIEGLTYPEIGTAWLKHKTLGPILRSVLRAQLQQENYMFLDAVAKRQSYKDLFHGFISTKAKYSINISGASRKKMEAAGNMGNFYDKKLWKDAIDGAVSDIDGLLQSNITDKILLGNKAFRAHHFGRMWYNRANFYKKWKKTKEMKKVEKFLGVAGDSMPLTAVTEAYAALKYKPKASKKAIEAVATASGKKPNEVKSIFKKVFKFK